MANGSATTVTVNSTKTEKGAKTLAQLAEALKHFGTNPGMLAWVENEKAPEHPGLRTGIFSEVCSNLNIKPIEDNKLEFQYYNRREIGFIDPVLILSRQFPGLMFSIRWVEGCLNCAAWLKVKAGQTFVQAYAEAVHNERGFPIIDLPPIPDDESPLVPEDFDETSRNPQDVHTDVHEGGNLG